MRAHSVWGSLTDLLSVANNAAFFAYLVCDCTWWLLSWSIWRSHCNYYDYRDHRSVIGDILHALLLVHIWWVEDLCSTWAKTIKLSEDSSINFHHWHVNHLQAPPRQECLPWALQTWGGSPSWRSSRSSASPPCSRQCSPSLPLSPLPSPVRMTMMTMLTMKMKTLKKSWSYWRPRPPISSTRFSSCVLTLPTKCDNLQVIIIVWS